VRVAGSAAETGPWNSSHVRLAVTQALSIQCRAAKDADECAKAIERSQESQGRFKRIDDLLAVLLPGGRQVELWDAPKEKVGTIPDDKISRHGYIEFLPTIGQHLVHVWGYEGTEYLLIDAKTGVRARVFGLPIPSPRGTWVACRFVNGSVDAQRVEVWVKAASGFERQWVHDTKWTPGFPEWLAEDAFRVERVGDGESGFATFSRSGSGWVERSPP
jgi:hypothetical protein